MHTAGHLLMIPGASPVASSTRRVFSHTPVGKDAVQSITVQQGWKWQWDPWLFSVNSGLAEIKRFPQQPYFEPFSLPAVDSWLLIHFIEALSVPWIKGSA